jgi:hypothetical protein
MDRLDAGAVFERVTNGARTLNGGAQVAAEKISDTAEKLGESAQKAPAAAKIFTLDMAHKVLDVMGVIRRIGMDDVLGTVGLARKRRSTPFAAMGSFGAGLAVGAGLGVLFAPKAGSDTRRAIKSGLASILGSAKKMETEVVAKVDEKLGSAAPNSTEKHN